VQSDAHNACFERKLRFEAIRVNSESSECHIANMHSQLSIVFYSKMLFEDFVC
jgi:hypothetical protein